MFSVLSVIVCTICTFHILSDSTCTAPTWCQIERTPSPPSSVDLTLSSSPWFDSLAIVGNSKFYIKVCWDIHQCKHSTCGDRWLDVMQYRLSDLPTALSETVELGVSCWPHTDRSDQTESPGHETPPVGPQFVSLHQEVWERWLWELSVRGHSAE